jgi:class 3 adenylate cyclase/predicted ATPase
MRCSHCGSDNPAAKKFCGDCGAALATRCPACAAENPPGKRFCGDCGTVLAQPHAAATRPKLPPTAVPLGTPAGGSEADGERKTVTALFADIKGSMELIEDLDPEEARAIVDPALALMMDAVHHYDGYVAQSTGDGIFALFGAPLAHEDHPQRALYAALRMQEDLKRYSDRMRAEGRRPIQVRVGVNTGEVVVRSIATGAAHAEYSPIGHSTGLAARMQALAPIGSIATTAAVRKLCDGYFLFKDLGPTRVKGVSEAVAVFEVTGLGPLRTRLQRAAGRGLTKFVGRQREMDALQLAAVQAKAGQGQIVAVIADPGVGKSRLFFEFKARSQSGWMALDAYSVSHGKDAAFLPVIDLLRTYFEIAADDDERKRREKVAGKVVMLDRALEDTLPNLFALLGIVDGPDPLAQMDPQVKRRRTLDAIKRLLLRESLNQPLMLIFEDLHWIDDETQALLNLLADSIATAKILLLVNYRPQYTHSWASKTYYTQLRLDPLGTAGAEELLASLLGSGPDLTALRRLIIEKTEGNPFFMEEMVQGLLDEGVLVRVEAPAGIAAPSLKLTRPLGELRIPSTVQAILASRIDRLPPGEKDLLHTLAVIGREFAATLLKHVVAGPADQLERMLTDLQVGEFIYERPAFPDSEYLFKHALTQQVAYDSILTERRRALHERIAATMETLWTDNLEKHFATIAHHYSSSGNVPKAVDYLRRAAEHAFRVSAHAEGIARLNSALQTLGALPESPERDRRELELRVALGPLLMATQGWSAADVESTYSRAFELGRRVDDAPRLFLTLRGLWEFHQARGDLEKGEEFSRQLFGLAERLNDSGLLLVAHDVCADTAFWIGDLERAGEQAERGIALYDQSRHRSLAFSYGGYDPAVACLCFSSVTGWLRGYPDHALEKIRAARALARQLAQPFSEAFALYFMATLHYLRRDAAAARRAARSAITLCEEGGFPFYLALCTALHGWAIAALGAGEDGIRQIRSGLSDYARTAAVLEHPLCLTLLADASHRLGETEPSAEAVTQALAAALKMGHRTYEAELYRLRGVLLAQSRAAEAEASFRQAIAAAHRDGARSWELRATMSLSRLLAAQGRRNEARVMLADIYGKFTEGLGTADLEDAAALLDDLKR